MTIHEIEARLAAIAQELETATGEALAALDAEARSLTEERTRLLAEIETRNQLRASIAAGQGRTTETHSFAAPAAPAAAPSEEETRAAEVRSFAQYIRGAVAEMRSGEQNFNLNNNGALLPTSIANRIIDTVVDICPILAGADVYHVRGTLKIPKYGKANTSHDITVAYGADFSELTADAGAFGSVELSGFLFGALTLIGRSLLNSSDIDLVAFVVRKMAEKIAVFVEHEMLVGTSNKCTGALSTTNTMNAGSTSAISADNLIDLQAKVKQAYQANACWTMHPNTFTAIKKLKDGNGRYLVQDDFSGAFPYRILGKPVYLSDNMPTIASAAKAVLYGDYSGMAVNIREESSVEVLREKYATQHAIGIVAWMEMDCDVADANKLATLVMSA